MKENYVGASRYSVSVWIYFLVGYLSCIEGGLAQS